MNSLIFFLGIGLTLSGFAIKSRAESPQDLYTFVLRKGMTKADVEKAAARSLHNCRGRPEKVNYCELSYREEELQSTTPPNPAAVAKGALPTERISQGSSINSKREGHIHHGRLSLLKIYFKDGLVDSWQHSEVSPR